MGLNVLLDPELKQKPEIKVTRGFRFQPSTRKNFPTIRVPEEGSSSGRQAQSVAGGPFVQDAGEGMVACSWYGLH